MIRGRHTEEQLICHWSWCPRLSKGHHEGNPLVRIVSRPRRGPDTHLRMVQGSTSASGGECSPKEVQEKPPAGSLRVSLRSLFNIPQEWGIKGVETSLRQRWWEHRE